MEWKGYESVVCWTLPVTLINDLDLGFSRSIFKKSIFQEYEGQLTWNEKDVSWQADPLCDVELWPHPWPRHWICKAKFWNIRIPRTGGPIDLKWNGCESIGFWTHYVTLNYDLDLGFSRSILKKLYHINRMADRRGTKGMWVYGKSDPLHSLWLKLWPHPWHWPWIFKVKFWKSYISGIGVSIDME